MSGNKARNKAGGIEFANISSTTTITANLVNCTIAGNTADSNDDGVNRDPVTKYPNGLGGGIFENVTYNPVLNIKNCLIAENYSGSSTPVPSDLCCDENLTPLPFSPNVDYSVLEVWDPVRVTLNGADNITGDQPNLNLSGTLADNGGPTQTLALFAGSVAIDAGTDTGAPAMDQRGYNRISPCDIGAYEYGASPSITSFTPSVVRSVGRDHHHGHRFHGRHRGAVRDDPCGKLYRGLRNTN